MFLTLTDLSDESLQSQIIRQVRAQVLSGELAAGESLPSIRALARDYKVSVITVQRAYENLERESIVISRRGKGFFVNELTSDQKKLMARERFAESLSPQLKTAVAEGLSEDEIKDIVVDLLKRDGR